MLAVRFLLGRLEQVSQLIAEIRAARGAVQDEAGWSDRQVEQQTVDELMGKLYRPGFKVCVNGSLAPVWSVISGCALVKSAPQSAHCHTCRLQV